MFFFVQQSINGPPHLNPYPIRCDINERIFAKFSKAGLLPFNNNLVFQKCMGDSLIQLLCGFRFILPVAVGR